MSQRTSHRQIARGNRSMTAKEYLKQYETATKRANRYKTEYEHESELVDSVRSTLGGDGQPHGTGVSKAVENRAIRLSDKFLKWKMAELDAIEKRQEVFDMICDIDGNEGDVLYQRYIMLHKWEEVCVEVHLSWRQTHRVHRKALEIIEQKMALNGTH